MVLFLHNTSAPPRRQVLPDEKYPRLLEEKGFTGVPSLCFMDADGTVVGQPTRSVRAFAAMHALAKRLLALRAAGAAATPAEQQERFLVELQLDLIPGDRIQAQASAWRLGVAEQALVAQKLVDVEVAAIMQDLRRVRYDDASFDAARARVFAMAKAGRTPSATTSGQFWQLVLEQASRQRDGELAQQAFAALRARYADEPSSWLDYRMQDWQQQLAAAQEK